MRENTLSGNQKYTLVIPTYNRPVLLSDLLYVLGTYGLDNKIYIADSSRQEVQEENARLCREYGSRVTHFGFSESIEFVDKIAAVCAKVETPFIALCADDDILMPGVVEESVSFLEQHEDYVACHGDYYGCFYQDDGTPGLRLDMKVTPIADEKPTERLLTLLMRYQYLFYSVCRTGIYRHMIGELRSLSPHFAELQSAISLVTAGKVHGLSKPHMVRNSSVPTLVDGRLCDPNLAIGASTRRFFIDYMAMRRKTLRALLASAGNLTSTQAEQAIDAGFLLYLRRCFASATVLGALLEQDLIGKPCYDTLFHIVHDRQPPRTDPETFSALTAGLARAFARGWPRGVQG